MASMYATPLQISYFDNPNTTMKYIEDLSEREGEIFAQGYIQACWQIKEAISDSKSTFLQACMAEPDMALRRRLIRYVKLLDSFEDSLEERIASILEEDEEKPLTSD